MDQPKQLVFGPVIIEWDARYKFPIAVNLDQIGMFTTVCMITYRYGDGEYYLTIPEGFTFDGASIPWIIRIVPGFAKLDWHLLAALPHDYACDNPNKIPRSVGDGIFVSVLVALAENRKDASKKLTVVQGYLMFLAVWTWTILTRIRNPPNNAAKPPEVKITPHLAEPIMSHSPAVRQADAVSEVEEITKSETAEPPPTIAVVAAGAAPAASVRVVPPSAQP